MKIPHRQDGPPANHRLVLDKEVFGDAVSLVLMHDILHGGEPRIDERGQTLCKFPSEGAFRAMWPALCKKLPIPMEVSGSTATDSDRLILVNIPRDPSTLRRHRNLDGPTVPEGYEVRYRNGLWFSRPIAMRDEYEAELRRLQRASRVDLGRPRSLQELRVENPDPNADKWEVIHTEERALLPIPVKIYPAGDKIITTGEEETGAEYVYSPEMTGTTQEPAPNAPGRANARESGDFPPCLDLENPVFDAWIDGVFKFACAEVERWPW